MPNFTHPSLDSIFLGSEHVGAKFYDFYLHDVPPASLIARHGDEPDAFLELPLTRVQELARDGGYVPEALLRALGAWKRTKPTLQQDEVQGRDVTPQPAPLDDLVHWTEAVRAAEKAAALLADVQVLGSKERGTLAIVCRDAAAARDAYRLVERCADELHLVAEKPTTRWLVYVHYHRP